MTRCRSENNRSESAALATTGGGERGLPGSEATFVDSRFKGVVESNRRSTSCSIRGGLPRGPGGDCEKGFSQCLESNLCDFKPRRAVIIVSPPGKGMTAGCPGGINALHRERQS